ncbi:hypothetical protein Clacol_008412 [Clathrus columnatus]|uniref:Galectin n=1 Tax=Clathrus columnatus TaxID=1419009 RepID=A0AAV5AK72_9AGAM|nr:hypothetical protein Clacol_008412 [Clathrus columnatus]
MIHTLGNPFVPRSSIIRFPNGIFEIRLHVHGVASEVQLVAHDNYVLVTGRLAPRARIDALGRVSTLLWSDYPCGYFGRDIPLNLNSATEVLVLERRQEAEDLIIRYTLRPKAVAYNCAPFARVDQFSGRGHVQSVYNDAFAPTQITPCGKGAACACGPQQYGQAPYVLGTSGLTGTYAPPVVPFPVVQPAVVGGANAGFQAGFSANASGNAEISANVNEGITLKEGVATQV